MSLIDIIRRAGRSLGQAKVRTLLTSLAIGVGAFTLTLVLAAGNGSRHYIDNLLSANANTQVIAVLPKGLTAKPGDTAPAVFGSKRDKATQQLLTDEDVTKIEKIEGVKSVTPSYQVDAQYVTRKGQKKYDVQAIADASSGLKMKLVAGQLEGGAVKSGHVIIPDSYLEQLGFKDTGSALGETLTISYVRPGNANNPFGQTKEVSYKIQAVETKPNSALNYQPEFKLSTSDLKTVYDFERSDTPGYGQFISLSVGLTDSADNTVIEQAVKDKGYSAFSAAEIQKTLFQFINIIEYGVAGFGGLAILAAIFGIINTQYISVLERTRQIGLMKALGMRGFDVLKLFMFEAAWIGFLGGIIGAGLAWMVVQLANPFISDKLSLGDDQLLLFSWLPTIGLIVALIVIAMLAGLLPARRAAKLDPIEALRTE